MSGCDLVTILDSTRSHGLLITEQSLSSEETQALVRAMESRVEDVELGYKMTLDIEALLTTADRGNAE